MSTYNNIYTTKNYRGIFMQIFTNIVFPILASIIAGIFLWRYINEPKLFFHFSIGHATTFPVQKTDGTIPWTQLAISLTILNSGKIPLRNVQIFHSVDIRHDQQSGIGNNRVVALGISPVIPHEFSEDGKILIFNSLVPKENITITYIYPVAINQTNAIHQLYPSGIPMIRSDETIGKFVKPTLQYFFPRWVQAMVWIMLIIGFWVSAMFLANLINLVKLHFIYSSVLC